MTRAILLSIAVVFVLALCACGGGKSKHNPPLPPGTTAVTPAELAAAVQKGFFATENAPSRFEAHGGSIYTVNALSNSMTVNSAADGSLVRTISFPVGAGPFDLEWSGDTCYICASGANAIYRYRAGQAALDAETVSLAAPELAGYAFIGPGQMAIANGTLFAPLSGIVSFGDPANNVESTYGPGRVAKVKLADFTFDGFVSVPYANPTVANASFAPVVYFVCTGGSQFHADFTPYAGTKGGLVAYDAAAGNIAYSLDLGMTLPSAFIAINSDNAYVGSNLRAEVYRVRLDTGVVLRGEADPISLTSDFSYVSSFAGLPGLGVLAASFNTDEVYFLDPNDDAVSKLPFSQPFDFKESETFFGGAQDLLFVANGDYKKVFVLLGVANKVGAVDLTELWSRIVLGSG